MSYPSSHILNVVELSKVWMLDISVRFLFKSKQSLLILTILQFRKKFDSKAITLLIWMERAFSAQMTGRSYCKQTTMEYF